MAKKVKGKRRGDQRTLLILVLGVTFVIFLSILEGPLGAAGHAASHLWYDLLEWQIHLYILGWILLGWGVYRVLKARK